jgi:hypothetical protein
MECIAKTSTGNPCKVRGEESRNGLCHVHDPNGKYQVQHPKFAEAVKKIQEASNVRPE